MSVATRPRALTRRPPSLCGAAAAAAHSELWGEEPGVADARQTQPATRSPARAELSFPPPASLPPSLCSSVVAAVADKCDVGRRGLPLSQAASASASPALARSRGRRLHLSAGRPGVRRGAGAPRAAHSAHCAHSARTRPAAARTRTRGRRAVPEGGGGAAGTRCGGGECDGGGDGRHLCRAGVTEVKYMLTMGRPGSQGYAGGP